MPTIELKWDSKDLKFWHDKRTEAAVLRAASKAGGDAIRFLRAGSSKLIRSRKRFKVSRVNNSLTLNYPRGQKSFSDLVWRMDVSGKPMPLGDLPGSQTRRGVKVAVNTDGRKLLAQAFIATMKSGHRGVFLREESVTQGPLTKRQTKLGHKFRVGRLPIAEVFTSRITDVFMDRGFIEFVQSGAQEKFTGSFQRLLPLELAKLK